MKLGRNEACPCGSGKKYKTCCMEKSASNPRPVPGFIKAQAPTSVRLNQLVDLFNAGRHIELERQTRSLIQQYPESGFVWKMLGASLVVQGKNALQVTKKAAVLLPDDAEVHNNYGNALLDLGQCDEAVVSYRRALRIKPDFVEAHNNLGNALRDRGQVDEAVASYLRALEINPGYADAYNNLGNARRDLGQLDEAVASYRRALERNPHRIEAHRNLGNALRDLGQFEEAVASHRRVLESLPRDADAHNALSIALKDFGQFGLSLDSVRQAVALKLQQHRSRAEAPSDVLFDRHRPKAPMPVTKARETLDIIKARFETGAIPWCLFAGTLLGVFRDGDLLPYDKDVDIALPCTVDRQQLTQLLTADGEFQLSNRFSGGVRDAHIYDMLFVHTRHHIGVDLFFWHPDGEDHFLVGPDHPRQPVLSRIDRFDLGVRDWRGSPWPIPVQSERYFRNVYGDCWQQPDPYYDTIVSSPSRIAASMPVVLCYGYEKLFSHFRERNWQATIAYCTQLQKRVVDPLVEEVAGWAQQQLSQVETAC
ncbi:MAG: tetratricopeptide (TPR) repeat protein [Bradyrhizobium sp.]